MSYQVLIPNEVFVPPAPDCGFPEPKRLYRSTKPGDFAYLYTFESEADAEIAQHKYAIQQGFIAADA